MLVHHIGGWDEERSNFTLSLSLFFLFWCLSLLQLQIFREKQNQNKINCSSCSMWDWLKRWSHQVMTCFDQQEKHLVEQLQPQLQQQQPQLWSSSSSWSLNFNWNQQTHTQNTNICAYNWKHVPLSFQTNKRSCSIVFFRCRCRCCYNSKYDKRIKTKQKQKQKQDKTWPYYFKQGKGENLIQIESYMMRQEKSIEMFVQTIDKLVYGSSNGGWHILPPPPPPSPQAFTSW